MPVCPSLRSSFSPIRFLGRGALILALGLGLLGLLAPAQAQTPVTTVKNDDGNVIFQINDDGGLVSSVQSASGNIPASGEGIRIMWYPAKAAFRAGLVGLEPGKEDVWNADNVGGGSVAFGQDTKANGRTSTALGTV